MQSAVFFIGTAGQPTIGDEIECSDLAVVAEAEEDRRKRAGIDVFSFSLAFSDACSRCSHLPSVN